MHQKLRLLIALLTNIRFSGGNAQPFHSRAAQLNRGLLQSLFWDGYVDAQCMWECAQRWLPTEINPLGSDIIYGLPPDSVTGVDCLTVLSLPSDQICANARESLGFQRCYISYCGGLYTKIPAVPESTGRENSSEDERKLWSYNSAYISTYGRARAPFQGCGFGDSYSWGPMPVGITAACFNAPDQVFSQPNHTILELKLRLSTDGRLKVTQRMRRFLTPIWTSPALPSYWSYNLKLRHVGTIDNPRTLSDLYHKCLSMYISSALAFTHVLSITSTSKYYIVEIFHFLAFCLIPELPLVLILHNLSDAIRGLLTGGAFQGPYLFAGICGLVIYEDSPRIRARLLEIDVGLLTRQQAGPRNVRWAIRLLAILFNIGLLSLIIGSYFKRLSYTYGRATFCSATGLDHRIGWVATASLGPLLATLVLHLRNESWELWVPVPHHAMMADWRLRLAIDLATAALVKDILIIFTGRKSIAWLVGSPLASLLGNPIVSTIAILILSFVFTFQPGLAAFINNPDRWLHRFLYDPRLHTILLLLTLALAFAYSVLIFLLQIFLDVEECADLALDFVLPWNYRWQVPNPSWLWP
ncbi:hypothetical protein PCL_09516 [Purpureocillium lilacinum]|uniref:Uncharacterized protein n=1 Tax=Purpureocillium lilacinum TaxID=33203 RepID=A0A2U3DQQ4_PURLI|nr:hypothetical protein PCL_09516 [Purpureocillium lilacinum]